MHQSPVPSTLSLAIYNTSRSLAAPGFSMDRDLHKGLYHLNGILEPLASQVKAKQTNQAFTGVHRGRVLNTE